MRARFVAYSSTACNKSRAARELQTQSPRIHERCTDMVNVPQLPGSISCLPASPGRRSACSNDVSFSRLTAVATKKRQASLRGTADGPRRVQKSARHSAHSHGRGRLFRHNLKLQRPARHSVDRCLIPVIPRLDVRPRLPAAASVRSPDTLLHPRSPLQAGASR